MPDRVVQPQVLIPAHEDFRMIVLANRPGFPFLGNDFYRVCVKTTQDTGGRGFLPQKAVVASQFEEPRLRHLDTHPMLAVRVHPAGYA